MPVTPNEILESAVELSEGGREVDWRNAGSRAYFAAFHHCRKIAAALEPHVDVSARDAHKVVTDVPKAGEGTPRRLGYMLIQCRRVRNGADYDIADSFRRETASIAMDVGGRILDLELEGRLTTTDLVPGRHAVI